MGFNVFLLAPVGDIILNARMRGWTKRIPSLWNNSDRAELFRVE